MNSERLRDLMFTRLRLAVVVFLACAAAVCAAARADGPVPADRRVPKNTVACVSLQNVAELKARWGETLWGKLTEDESLREFRGDLEKQIAEGSRQIEEQLGLSVADLLAIPQGEVAGAVFTPEGAGASVVLFLDYGANDESLQKVIAKAAQALEQQKIERFEDEAEGTTLILHRRPAEDATQPPRDVGGYFLKDSTIVIGSSAPALKAVAARWSGTSDDVLAESDVYQYIMARCRDEISDSAPLLTWYVDPLGALKSALAANPQVALQGGLVLGMLQGFGIDKLRGLGGNFDMARGDFDMVSRTFVMMDPSPRGLTNLFQFEAQAQAPPKWVSAESGSYTTLHWNIEKAWTTAEMLVDSTRGPGTMARMIDGLAENPQSGNIHIKKDVIDQMTGRVHIVSDSRGSGELLDERYLFAIEMKNAAAARATLARVSAIPGLSFKEREFQGERIYEVAGGGEEDEEGGGTSIGAAVTEGHLMIATDVRLLEQIMRGGGDRETLAETALYRQISSRFPAQTASISFSRQDTQIKAVYELLKSGSLPGPVGGDLPVDFSKLPDFDAIKKYLPASGSFMERDERGLRMTSFSLKSEQ